VGLGLVADQGALHRLLHGQDRVSLSRTFRAGQRIRRKQNKFGPNPCLHPLRLSGQERGQRTFTPTAERQMQETNDSTAKNWVLGVTSLASFMMALDAMVVTTAFATIRTEFGASVETLQWTVNAFNLTFAVLLLTGAAL